MRRPVAIGVAATLALAASASEASPKRTVIDRIVAVVDGDVIPKSELDRFVAPVEVKVRADNEGRPGDVAAILARVRQEALTSLVERRLFLKEAEHRKIDVTDAEIDAAVAAVAAQNHVAIHELMRLVEDSGMDEAQYRLELRGQLLEGRLISIDMPTRHPEWKVLPREAQIERTPQDRNEYLNELRAKAFIEVRL